MQALNSALWRPPPYLHAIDVHIDGKESVQLPYTPQPRCVGLAVEHEELLACHLKHRQAPQCIADIGLVDTDLIQPECWQATVLSLELFGDLRDIISHPRIVGDYSNSVSRSDVVLVRFPSPVAACHT